MKNELQLWKYLIKTLLSWIVLFNRWHSETPQYAHLWVSMYKMTNDFLISPFQLHSHTWFELEVVATPTPRTSPMNDPQSRKCGRNTAGRTTAEYPGTRFRGNHEGLQWVSDIVTLVKTWPSQDHQQLPFGYDGSNDSISMQWHIGEGKGNTYIVEEVCFLFFFIWHEAISITWSSSTPILNALYCIDEETRVLWYLGYSNSRMSWW